MSDTRGPLALPGTAIPSTFRRFIRGCLQERLQFGSPHPPQPSHLDALQASAEQMGLDRTQAYLQLFGDLLGGQIGNGAEFSMHFRVES
jgi:hypothetical protein